jgi:hypothetical protein
MTDQSIYAEPENPALPKSGFVLDLERAALVITDPLDQFMGSFGMFGRQGAYASAG